MRIAVDGQLIVKNRTGMGIYTFNILRYWDTSSDELFIYIPDRAPEDLGKLAEKKGFNLRIIKGGNYFKWEQLILPSAVKKDNVDLLLCPYCTAPFFPPCPIVAVIHDTIYMEVKLSSARTLYKKMGLIYRRLTAPVAAKKAISVATVSEYAKRQVCKFFPATRSKIYVVPNGVDPSVGLSEQDRNKFFKENNIDKNYILGFGSLEARKNSMSLIRAYEQLDDNLKDCNKLVLFGFRGYDKSVEKAYIESHGLNHSVIPLGYISDAEKKSLYENCSVFVFPTLSEGFGIPVLEAFDSNVPVITSNVTSLPEVAGSGAILIEPMNVKAITSSITEILTNSKVAKKLTYEGRKQVEKYSWKSASEKMQRMIHNTI